MTTLLLDRFGRILQVVRPGAGPDDRRAARPPATRATFEFDETTNADLAARVALDPAAFTVVNGQLFEGDTAASVNPEADKSASLRGLAVARRDIRAYLAAAPVATTEGRALRALCRLVLGMSEELR